MTSSPHARTRFDREAARAALSSGEFDVVVIGGGVTGAGAALDAASRGLRTALVERDDFASGTSSKSSKLIHGGLRYLQQKEYLLVYENLHERQRLLDNAPHLVSPLPFLVPIFGKAGAVNATVAKAYSTALWLYDLTGGIRIGKRHRRIDVDELVELTPGIRRDRVAAGFLYYDARADDARLTLTLARTAVLDHGAVAVNHMAATGLTKAADGRVTAVQLADGTAVRTRAVINAGGVWADDVRSLDEGGHPDSIRPAKGVHIAVPFDKLPTTIAAVLPVPKDRRSIFVIPWADRVYLGTTDTDYDGPVDEPQCTADDVRYILDAVNLFSVEKITEADVLGTWAGLRPLVKGEGNERTADLSRRHTVRTSPSGVVTVTGGKLTTYRKMAEDAVDAVVDHLGRDRKWRRRTATKKLLLRGAEGSSSLRERGAAGRLGTQPDVLEHLAGRFGAESRVVLAMIEADPELGGPLVPGLPYLRAEAVYAVRYEMATTLEDVLSRRTRSLLLARDACLARAADVAKLLAPELGWTAEESARQVEEFTRMAEREKTAMSLPEGAHA